MGKKTLLALMIFMFLIWSFSNLRLYGGIEIIKPDINDINMPTWSQLLRAFERHRCEDKQFVENVAKSKEISIEKKLAMVLVNEWDLDPESKELTKPFLLQNGPIEKSILKILGIVILKIDVDSDGRPSNIEFLRPKGQENKKEKDVVLCSMKKSYFRPSLINGKYSAGKIVITLRIEYRIPQGDK